MARRTLDGETRTAAKHPVWARAGAWLAFGRANSATVAEFFAELGDRRHSIRAVSIDMSGEYQRAIRDAVPEAENCFDTYAAGIPLQAEGLDTTACCPYVLTVIGIPLRYVHSPVETVELDDVENTAKPIAAFARRLSADVYFRR